MNETESGHELNTLPAELLAPVERLGSPIAIFRTNPQYSSKKFFLGVLLILGGVIANIFYWREVQAINISFWLFSPIITGFGFLYAVWRDRGLWVLIYSTGILRWQNGTVVTFPWNDLESVSLHRVQSCGRPKRLKDEDGEFMSVWLPIEKMRSYSMGAHLDLLRNDGSTAIFPSSLTDFQRFTQVVQEETFKALWIPRKEAFQRGEWIDFGPVSLSRTGIHFHEAILRWRDFEDTFIHQGKLVIRSKSQKFPWVQIPLNYLMNPHIFAAMVLHGLNRHRTLMNERLHDS